MAIAATFTANFSKFYDAVDKAIVKVADFEEGAAKVGPRLDAMVAKFSGKRIIEESALMVRAIEEIGGVSALTAKELQNAGAKAAEAAEKMKALGMDVPKGLTDIADAAKRAADETAKMNAEKLKAIEDAAKPAFLSVENLFGSLKNLAGTLGIGFSIGSLIGLGKSILDSVDALTRLHDQTGISLQGLQRFQIAGDDAGNSIDQITGAITKMEDKFASADPVALKALSDLKIPLEDIKNLNPENQFIAISDAIRQVKDPAEQVRLAIDLFGKSGAEVLPTLKRGFDDVKDAAVGMSDETIKRMDDASDRVGAFWRATKGYLALAAVELYDFAAAGFNPFTKGVNDAKRETEAFNAELKRMADAIKPPTKNIQDMAPPLKVITSQSAEFLHVSRETDDALAKQAAALKKAGDEAKRLSEKNEELAKKEDEKRAAIVASARALEAGATSASFAVKGLTSIGVVEAVDPWTLSFNKLVVSLRAIEQPTTDAVIQMAQLEKVGEKVNVVIPKMAKALGPQLKDAIGGLNDIMMKAFEGGGGIVGAVQSYATKITSSVLGMIPGIGGVLSQFGGALVGGVSKLFGSLFGGGPEKQVNPIRQQFIDAAGGLDVLNERAAAAGVTLTALLDAKNPQQYEAAIKSLQAAFDGQKAGIDAVNEAAQRYGFTIEELGPALQRQQLDEQAQQLYKDFTLLTKAGVDQVAITDRMSQATNDYLQTSLKLGVEVPSAMRPMLEAMAKAGQLTDANGDKIEDLDAAGVKFSMTMTEGFTALIKSVDKLADVIGRTLGGAIDSTSDKISKIPRNVDVAVNFKDSGIRMPSTEGPELEGYAEGTDGFRNFGAGTPVMLHGWEAVVPREAASTPGGALPGGDTGIVINVNAQGAFFDTPDSLQRLADKVSSALTAKYGLTNKFRAA